MAVAPPQPDFRVAEAIAADLAGAQVDVNEAQKALAYLRGQGKSKALFDYLQAVVNNGQVVIRSRRTLGYYKDLLVVCQRHLRPLQGDYATFVQTFAWSLRLLRYFRVVPQRDQVRLSYAENAAPQAASAPAPVAAEPSASATPARPTGPQLPPVGAIFPGKILEIGDDAMFIEIPGFAQAKAIGVVQGEGLAKRFRVGNAARVEVTGTRTAKSGRMSVELQLARKS